MVKIAVASGKGGTGKTTVSVNLALSLGGCALVDCDVEEPNCLIFLDVEPETLEEVCTEIPRFDMSRCTLCGKCAEFCRFNALAVIPSERLLFFPELCHACGGCAIICPEEAVAGDRRSIGRIDHASDGELDFYQGVLDVGEAMATPVIRRLKACVRERETVILDSPPGTACPMLETVQGADFVILVTEPTPFGLHDLKVSVESLRSFGMPIGVIINRVGIGDYRVDEYCRTNGIPVLMRIPESRRIAELYSRGVPFVSELNEYLEGFRELRVRIANLVEGKE